MAVKAMDEPLQSRGFQALNRGIVVGALFFGVGLLALQLTFTCELVDPGLGFALYGGIGFVAGTVTALSNTATGDRVLGSRGLDLSDALMTGLWLALGILAVHQGEPLAPGLDLIWRTLTLIGSALLGALIGEPLALFIGRLRVKGRRPFRFVNDLTEGIHNDDHRFIVRVLLQTAMLALLIALATTIVFLVLALLALALAGWFLSAATSDGRTQTRVRVRIPKGGRVRDDGVIVDKKRRKTGQRIADDGRVLESGERTGLRIDDDGDVLVEGLLSDRKTGAALRDEADGQHIVQEALLSEKDTDIRLDSKGRPKKKGFFGDRDVGVSIDSDGNVREEP